MNANDASGAASWRAQLMPAVWLAVRLILGVEWIRAGVEKIGASGWTTAPAGAAVEGFLHGAVANASGEHPEVADWFVSAKNHLFLPNATLIAILVSYGELLVGIALIVGFLTRVTAVFGLLMNLVFLLAGTTSTNPQMMLAESAIILVGVSAGVYGLDGWLLPWLRNRSVQYLRAARLAAIAIGLLALSCLAMVSTDPPTWLGAALIAMLLAVAVVVTHLQIPALLAQEPKRRRTLSEHRP